MSHHEDHELSATEKEELKQQKLGFAPTTYCNLAGVVAGGVDRQRVLQQASRFVTASTSLTCFNKGIWLVCTKDNMWDEFAVEVWLATNRVGAQYTGHEKAGFMPRRICTSCQRSWGGQKAEVPSCPYCSAYMRYDTISYLNRFVCQNYLDQGKGIWHSVWWINQGPMSKGGVWGCQIALAFPPMEVKPPDV